MSQVSKGGVPRIALVGRMNVGKSTLFNRLAQKVKSITLDFAGVTRDFLIDRVSWKNSTFDLIDTGGIDLRKTEDELTKKVQQQVFSIIEKSDAILFLVDGKAGIGLEDKDIAIILRRLNKNIIVVVNKMDVKKAQEQFYDFYELGFEKVIGISAEHGLGINDLLDSILSVIVKKEIGPEEEPTLNVAFIGRPNVGKSSLLNLLLKEERAIVSEVPGTTREAIAEKVKFYQESILLIDTPGIRRKRAVKEELESLMVKSSFRALQKANIMVLIIDGSQSTIVDQELKLAFYAFTEQKKALILAINKIDLMTNLDRASLKYNFEYYKHLIQKIPVLEISCKTNKNIGKLLPLIQKVWTRCNQKFKESELTHLFITALHKRPLYHQRQKLELIKAKQLRNNPLTLELVVNEPDWFGPSQLMFFENLMHSEYDLKGIPVKFMFKKFK